MSNNQYFSEEQLNFCIEVFMNYDIDYAGEDSHNHAEHIQAMQGLIAFYNNITDGRISQITLQQLTKALVAYELNEMNEMTKEDIEYGFANFRSFSDYQTRIRGLRDKLSPLYDLLPRLWALQG